MQWPLFSLGVATFLCELALAQPAQSPAFEVASVKPAVVPTSGRVCFGPARGGPGTPDPGQITWEYARLIDMLMAAYDVKNYQVRGPDWISTERFLVRAQRVLAQTEASVKKHPIVFVRGVKILAHAQQACPVETRELCLYVGPRGL